MKDFLKGLVLLSLFGAYQVNAAPPSQDKTCHMVADHAKTIHEAYVKDIDIGAVIIVYQGNDKWSVGMRDLVTKIYRSDSKDLDSREVYRFFYAMCMTK